eukprot:TRINITY_DN11398_c0_g1_i1.p1 TRINITY_DN11398_c0_g1~~TRINITY_DN11398_c0_g1_i1.p1  ORF type:complete len:328 (-),score=54.18 TRINITY_DN11398_c0_g1_i1:143-1126(-)
MASAGCVASPAPRRYLVVSFRGKSILIPPKGTFSDLDKFLRTNWFEKKNGFLGAHMSQMEVGGQEISRGPAEWYQFTDGDGECGWSDPLAEHAAVGSGISYHYDLGGGIPTKMSVTKEVMLVDNDDVVRFQPSTKRKPAASASASAAHASSSSSSPPSCSNKKAKREKKMEEFYPNLQEAFDQGDVFDFGRDGPGRCPCEMTWLSNGGHGEVYKFDYTAQTLDDAFAECDMQMSDCDRDDANTSTDDVFSFTKTYPHVAKFIRPKALRNFLRFENDAWNARKKFPHSRGMHAGESYCEVTCDDSKLSSCFEALEAKMARLEGKSTRK